MRAVNVVKETGRLLVLLRLKSAGTVKSVAAGCTIDCHDWAVVDWLSDWWPWPNEDYNALFMSPPGGPCFPRLGLKEEQQVTVVPGSVTSLGLCSIRVWRDQVRQGHHRHCDVATVATSCGKTPVAALTPRLKIAKHVFAAARDPVEFLPKCLRDSLTAAWVRKCDWWPVFTDLRPK